MPRQQTPDQQNKGRGNPGTFSPDDDEAQEADRTRDLPRQSEQRQAQDDRRRPEENIEQVEDEEAEEDEDESDHISERP